ncbi:hypothetical protein F4802DRAFT_596618 [Xylaria palmicola]|nr:hypothetical protein F4802DRAFT_596618 [Xylaria palmicola]
MSPSANTSLWITGLNSNITYTELFQGIRKIGRVRQAFINEPDKRNRNTCAAKLTFFSREAALKLLDQAAGKNFVVQGMTPTVVWNRYYIPEEPADGRSRVLRIRGPIEIVNRPFLETFWSRQFFWGTDRVSDVGEVADGVAVVWYYFASWRAQAALARIMVLQHFGDRVTVTYERDPCGC